MKKIVHHILGCSFFLETKLLHQYSPYKIVICKYCGRIHRWLNTETLSEGTHIMFSKWDDEELYQVSLAMGSRLADRNTFFTEDTAKAFNNVLNHIRLAAKGRQDERSIRHAILDDFEDDDE